MKNYQNIMKMIGVRKVNQWGRRHPNRKVAKAKTEADLQKIVRNNIKWEPISDIKPVENSNGTLLYYAQLLQLKDG